MHIFVSQDISAFVKVLRFALVFYFAFSFAALVSFSTK